jgi:hypothetical protein
MVSTIDDAAILSIARFYAVLCVLPAQFLDVGENGRWGSNPSPSAKISSIAIEHGIFSA